MTIVFRIINLSGCKTASDLFRSIRTFGCSDCILVQINSRNDTIVGLDQGSYQVFIFNKLFIVCHSTNAVKDRKSVV